ncbi:MAG TPA: tetratricopeptide repeat protein [Terriglobales bacterium]|nr:tetratricopeptide repeat protein [Terriglobales bacterium]
MAAANWHPLTWMSHALDCQLFGLNAAAHHADSVLIHTANAVLLFLLLRWLTGLEWQSLMVAALFAIHPLNVESVAWVAERKNVLSTALFWAAIGAYAWYARNPRWKRYLVVVALFALGLMAKPMVITLPFVLLLLDYWPLGRTLGSPPLAFAAQPTAVSKLVLEKLPLLVLSAASAAVTLRAQRLGSAVQTLDRVPLFSRVENATVAYCLYLWKTLWPSKLAAFYPHSAADLLPWQWILASLILIFITVFAVGFRNRRYLLVGWLWFLGTLVPVIGLVQVGGASMADRYGYLPLVGIFVMVVWGVNDLQKANGWNSRLISGFAVCVLIALSVVTYRQIGYWDSEYDVWAHTLEVTKANSFAEDAIGSALTAPDVAMSEKNLEAFDSERKRTDEAHLHYQRALAIRKEMARDKPSAYLPDVAFTLINLGNLERNASNNKEASLDYEEAAGIHTTLIQQKQDSLPEDGAAAFANLGTLEANESRTDTALVHLSNALEIYRQLAKQNPAQYLPNVADMLNDLAVIERGAQRWSDAQRYYEELLPVRRQLAEQDRANVPSLAMTLNDLGILYGIENRSDEARQRYEESLKLYQQLSAQDPGTYKRFLAGTLNNLALLYSTEGRFQESRAFYGQALSIYQDLSRREPDTYAADVARIEARLNELDKKSLSRSAAR